MVGLTIVAFGTSAPELFISTIAAFKGSTSIAIGNIIGSNIANTGLILGFSALIHPPGTHSSIIKFQLPFAIVITGIFFLFCLNGSLGRLDSLILLALFVLFTIHCVYSAREANSGNLDAGELLKNRLREILFILGGLVGLEFGSDIFVRGAVKAAELLGVSEFMIGLSLVALGTSLPELATTIVAAARHESDIVIGNIIGSCIFNILLVMGVVGSILPINDLAEGINIDMLVMFGLTVLLLPMLLTGRRLSRPEGALLLLIYAGYISFVAIRG